MGKNQGMLERMAQALDLPGELVPGVPLIEICGSARILVENHRGIRAYSDTLIIIGVKRGCFTVRGCRLRLEQMMPHKLVITGTISGVDLEMGGRE